MHNSIGLFFKFSIFFLFCLLFIFKLYLPSFFELKDVELEVKEISFESNSSFSSSINLFNFDKSTFLLLFLLLFIVICIDSISF